MAVFPTFLDFAESWVGKESTCNTGDPGLIPGWEGSAGEGIDCPLQYSWAFLAAQLKESACSARDLGSIPGLGRSPGEGKGYSFQYSGLENSVDYCHKELDTIEQFSLLFTFPTFSGKVKVVFFFFLIKSWKLFCFHRHNTAYTVWGCVRFPVENRSSHNRSNFQCWEGCHGEGAPAGSSVCGVRSLWKFTGVWMGMCAFL